ncbi:unnamed protein product [Xylocopa violacea]|uniref:Uncharacterized protein n=1 Tax=Xylocopa violacea TaxID=135666 RepID=A0ABP1N8U4_XYLVO
MVRTILNTAKPDLIETIRQDLQKNMYKTDKTLHIESELLTIETTLTEIIEQVHDLNLAIILGKQGIINPNFVKPKDFIEHLQQIISHNALFSHIKPVLENYQLLLDISSLTLYTLQNKIIYQISVPLLEDEEWLISKLYSIPHKQNNVFIAPILEHNLVLQTSTQFILVDESYRHTKCKTNTVLTICERTQPTHSKSRSKDCQSQIINAQDQITNICNFAIFKIEELTFTPLDAHDQFIVIPKQPTEIHTLCKSNTQITLTTPSLIRTNEDCTIIYNENVMKLGGIVKSIEYEFNFKNFSLNYSEDDLQLIDKQIRTAPRITPNFND